jgi:hypothetical protein
MWAGIANVYRNRWKLSQPDKIKYRSLLGDPNQSFGRMIYKSSAAADRHFDNNLVLKYKETQNLIRILNGSPDSQECRSMISAFSITNQIYADHGTDNTNGALQYIHVWWPSNPFGPTIHNALGNPFGGPFPPQLTYATNYLHYGSVNGVNRYVSTFYYRPGF